jgi:hypothetical protein
MLRTRVLRPRCLSVVLILWAVAWLALPVPGDAMPLPPSRAPGTGTPTPSAVELTPLRDALVTQGLTAADADLVIARLSPAERAELAQRVDEAAVGGDPSLILIAAIVIIIAILLYLPMAGRMQGWWR